MKQNMNFIFLCFIWQSLTEPIIIIEETLSQFFKNVAIHDKDAGSSIYCPILGNREKPVKKMAGNDDG